MNLFNQELMYEIHASELMQVDAVKHYTEHLVKKVKSIVGWDTHVQVNIEPESKDKKLFTVSIAVFGMSEPVIVTKDGRNVMATLHKVGRTVLRQINRQCEKRLSFRRREFFKEQMVS